MMVGGKFGRTYVSGDTRRASSSRLGTPANHSIAHERWSGPGCNCCATSVMPKKSTMAATLTGACFVRLSIIHVDISHASRQIRHYGENQVVFGVMHPTAAMNRDHRWPYDSRRAGGDHPDPEIHVSRAVVNQAGGLERVQFRIG